MQELFHRAYLCSRSLIARNEAQNLTEYALAVAVIGLASVAGMEAVANSINREFLALANIIDAGMR